MAVFLSPVGGAGAQFFDNSGNVLTGGLLYTYAAGTTTVAATFTSGAGNVQHSNPIVLDASGRVPGSSEIWLTDSVAYKFVLKTSAAVLIGTWDNITGINSNFVNFEAQEEVQTATAGQTVFNLTTITYTPGSNNLQVFIDGANQIITDSYVETDANTVTFVTGLHVGALVKFTTAVANSSGIETDASLVSYDPPLSGSVATNVEAKLAQTVSVKDFGAVGDGVTDDAAALQIALNWLQGGTFRGLSLVSGLTYIAESKLTLTAATNFVILGNGATIKAKNGRPVAGAEEIIVLSSCVDGFIENLTINGNRANRTPTYITAQNFIITNASYRLTLSNVHSDNAPVEGFLLTSASPTSLANTPTDITFINCGAKNAWSSNFVAVQSVNFTDYNGKYLDANGSALNPLAGMDFEPNGSSPNIGNVNVQLFNTDASGNDGSGFSAAHNNTFITARNLIADNCGIYGFNNSGALLDLDGFRATTYGVTTVAVIDCPSTAYLSRTILKNLYFQDINTASANKPCVLLRGNDVQRQTVDGLTTVNCTAPALLTQTPCYASGVKVIGYTGDTCIQIYGNASTLKDFSVNITSASRALAVAGTDTVIDGGVVNNCQVIGSGVMDFLAGSLRATVRNCSVHQDTSFPVGQIAYQFAEVPLIVENISAYSLGTDYTPANVVLFTAGSIGAAISGIRPFGVPYTDAISVGNVGGGEDTLMTKALYAPTILRDVGDSLSIVAWGVRANNTNPATIKLYFGATAVANQVLAVSTANAWVIRADVIKASTGNFVAGSQTLQAGTPIVGTQASTFAEVDTGNITFKCTGTVTDGGGGINNNDITQTGFIIERSKKGN